MKVVILCGGKGTRLREETEYRPKPMVPIGGRPILWHIMKTYAHYGFKDFILCLGYKGDMIKDFFRNYLWEMSDVSLSLGKIPSLVFHDCHDEEEWRVTLADTGEDSMTGYRVKRIKKYIGTDETFLLTYGDGVGAINIPAVIDHHHRQARAVTLTGVHPPGRFGELDIAASSRVVGFNEKPQVAGGYINGGYMVCSQRVFDYLPDDPDSALEGAPMKELVKAKELTVFQHEGFWQCMDTYAEFTLLNELWASGQAPWAIWKKP